MDRLIEFSEQLATAVQHAARTVCAVHGRPRVPSSGIVWRPGLLVTANHTVHNDEELTVTSPSGRSASATLVGRDAALDLAVLKVDGLDAAVADVGDSDAVRVGHVVLALGAGTRASWGIVSAIETAGRSQRDVFSLDLTLYPGFSGGPLVDAKGAVIGVNTSGATRQRQVAIPAQAVTGVVEAAMRHGRVPQAYLGVGTQPIRVPDAQRTGLMVVDVQAGSPAAGALLVGDIILAIDGEAIADPLRLRAMLRPERIGQQVRVSVIRAGQRVEIDVTIAERPTRAR